MGRLTRLCVWIVRLLCNVQIRWLNSRRDHELQMAALHNARAMDAENRAKAVETRRNALPIGGPL